MFIQQNVADFPLQLLREVPSLSRSAYYAWARRTESARAAPGGGGE